MRPYSLSPAYWAPDSVLSPSLAAPAFHCPALTNAAACAGGGGARGGGGFCRRRPPPPFPLLPFLSAGILRRYFLLGGGAGDGIGFLMFSGFCDAPLKPLPRRLGARFAIIVMTCSSLFLSPECPLRWLLPGRGWGRGRRSRLFHFEGFVGQTHEALAAPAGGQVRCSDHNATPCCHRRHRKEAFPGILS